jgi:hypothetical protein
MSIPFLLDEKLIAVPVGSAEKTELLLFRRALPARGTSATA